VNVGVGKVEPELDPILEGCRLHDGESILGVIAESVVVFGDDRRGDGGGGGVSS